MTVDQFLNSALGLMNGIGLTQAVYAVVTVILVVALLRNITK